MIILSGYMPERMVNRKAPCTFKGYLKVFESRAQVNHFLTDSHALRAKTSEIYTTSIILETK